MRLDCSYKMVTQVDSPNLQGDYDVLFLSYITGKQLARFVHISGPRLLQ